MTPVHAPASPVARRTPGGVIRGLLAVIALAAFVIGVPVALLLVAPLAIPQNAPTWDSVIGAMTRPDDGGLLLGAIQVIAWVAWAAFTTSVIAELVAAVRRVSAPHIPLLGGTQRLAATLVTTAGLLLATTTPLTSTATAREPVTAMASLEHVTVVRPDASSPAPETPPRTASPAARNHAPEAPPGQTITVQRGDTLWDLAERHLGDGHRYTEILALNLGHPQADGRALDDAHWIYPGWQLRLPAGATVLGPAIVPAAPGDGDGTYTVERGDTLWDIAGEHLGDPARYPEIVALNQGVPQPGGGALTDPDLIRPGWLLTLPIPSVAGSQAAPAAAAAAPSAGLQAAVPPNTPDVVTGDDATPRVDDKFSRVDDASGAADDAPARADDAPTRADDAPESAVDVPDDAEAPNSSRSFYLGLTALAAAGVIGELARRRKLQQRARRIGQRIALPAAGTPSREAERTLRDAVPPLTIAALKQALLNLASRCYAAERDLPRLAAITLTTTDVVMHLSEDDADPVEPFTTAGARTWVASHVALASDAVVDDPDRPEPFPALVTLGHTSDGTVLLNLEAAGTLTLTGDTDAAADVLRALVAELATSDLTGRIGLIAGPQFAGLAAACDSARLQIATPESLTAQIAQRSDDVARALGGTAADDTLQARSDRAVGDVWLPVLYVGAVPPSGMAPWSGGTVIGLGAAASSGWTLTVDADHASLDQLGFTLQPQRLTAANLDMLVNLLTTATPPDTADPAVEAPALYDEIGEALAALATPQVTPPWEQPGGPTDASPLRINVLGPITIEGLSPDVGTHLSRRSTELLVYLAIRGRATGPELDEALWHGQRIDSQTRNSLVYRTRQRVGPETLPVAGPDGIYRLGPSVTCDWSEFQTLAHRGLAGGPEGIEDLQAALDLVRDRPLLGIRDRNYTWAEYDIQHMISAIADAAHVLAQLLAASGDHRGAVRFATKGLLADSCSEVLYADAVAGAEAVGDYAEARRLLETLDSVMTEFGADDADEIAAPMRG
ncbi:MAG: LysM peptidoglycan-binding domain-containing protein [Actinomycetales bacterium]|nr:LysM peptidoglycan-binding domain-containing protein [Actinomycetales bacterium]